MQYIIGIDLGTTNCCVSYVDTHHPKMPIQPFRIPQIKTQGVVSDAPTLPSFCYLPAEKEFPERSLELPWKKGMDFFVGEFAKSYGAKVPTRLIQSAKSWLCHSAANRRDKILPFESDDLEHKISPVEATARYLTHIKGAWNHMMARNDPEAEFEQQEIVLTVPASFDEAARTLTIEAAKQAGFSNLTLLEEPQAAFYSWISHHEDSWESTLKPGQIVLVCDVGGGTTDFSLIEVAQKDGKLGFSRMAVGDHLLLGGDNMDAAIAHQMERSQKKELNTTQWLQLLHEARKAKEILLSSDQGHYQISIQGTGSSVVHGSFAFEAEKESLQGQLIEGFFGQYEWEEALNLKKTTGIRAMGLPYEDEPSITKHLAYFLQSNQAKPDYLLFNGGSMKPEIFQQSILDILRKWFPEKKTELLISHHLDLAVARGAAYYGKVRRGFGVKIGGGSARSYYLALETTEGRKAITLLARGAEEGASYQPEQIFNLTPNVPVSFQMYSSHVRLHDNQAELVEIDPLEMQALPPIFTIFKYGSKDNANEKIPVHVKIELTPLGTIEVSLISAKTTHRWTLEFQLKTSSGQENTLSTLDNARSDLTFSQEYLNQAKNVIQELFAANEKPLKVMELLETKLEIPRKDWPVSVLRGLADVVIKEAPNRKKNSDLEARWWNLVGFFMRPGFGFPLDDYRIKELWKVILSETKSSKTPECLIQQWICLRRISGGLTKGQQIQVANELIPLLLAKNVRNEDYAYSEIVRTLGSLELIDTTQKVKIANHLLSRMNEKKARKAEFWALGRLGARHLLYGSAVNVVSKKDVEEWIKRLLTYPQYVPYMPALLGQLAKKTDHRELNLSQSMIEQILGLYPDLSLNLSVTSAYDQREKELIFGEHLPVGLSL